MLDALRHDAALVEAELDRLLPLPAPGPRRRLQEAVRYAVLGGGKRLRPFLLLQTARLFGVPPARALRAAAAIEMLHCYSLVHDDLPAMDDSSLRRGKPTVHRAFDEATAILVGDALLTHAFAVLADPQTHPDAELRCQLVAGLAGAGGIGGMIGGQAIDLADERKELDLEGIQELQSFKTGALIVEACRAGARLGEASQEEIEAVEEFGSALGLAFQIVDDLLDAEGDPTAVGKPVGQDAAADKATFVGRLGTEAARERAAALIEAAKEALATFGGRAALLQRTADFVLTRQV
ncbi:MAG TPA: farnesyl diphosphate synthase [Kiloniellales bacterium]|nr:farnesyl diphosphate synthase [Kiloniellales bacterium]